MKVGVATAREPITELHLRLKSTDLCFINCCYPSHLEYPPNTQVIDRRENQVYIEFMDSREIDMLIDALNRFKDENIRRMGYWR